MLDYRRQDNLDVVSRQVELVPLEVWVKQNKRSLLIIKGWQVNECLALD